MTAVAVACRESISDAGLLFLKVVAFGAMVADHADWMLFGGALGFHATVGRVVFPLFAIVLALNLARIDDTAKLYSVAVRMALFGVLAFAPYVYLQGAVIPLNVLYTLAASVLLLAFWREGMPIIATMVGVVVGFFVDYAWFGLLAVLVPVAIFRAGWSVMVPSVLVPVLLLPINGSLWAWLAVPVIFAADQLRGDAPRLKWLFYVGYPAHLLALAVFKALAAA